MRKSTGKITAPRESTPESRAGEGAVPRCRCTAGGQPAAMVHKASLAHLVRIRCTVVIEELVVASSLGSHLVHAFLHDAWGVEVVAVVGNGSLEEDVGALPGGALHRGHRGERAILEVSL